MSDVALAAIILGMTPAVYVAMRVDEEIRLARERRRNARAQRGQPRSRR